MMVAATTRFRHPTEPEGEAGNDLAVAGKYWPGVEHLIFALLGFYKHLLSH